MTRPTWVPRLAAGAEAPARELAVPGWVLAALALLLVGATALGISRQWPVNDDKELTDQSAYLNYVESLQRYPDGIVADRNRMPLYPWVAGLLVDPDDPVEDRFADAKAAGVVIAALGLAATAGWAWRRSGPLAAVTGTGIVALTIVAFKAPYAQADVLSFFLLLASAVGCWRLLRAPTVVVGAVTGLALGLSQLAKSNATPMAAIVVALAGAALVLPSRLTGMAPAQRRRLPAALVAMGLLVVATLASYGVNSEHRYGTPTYNTNSTYYLWYDSFDEVEAGTSAHGDQLGRPAMPEEEVPTLARYRRTHDLGDVRHRFVDGFRRQLSLVQSSYGYWPFVLLSLAGLAGTAVLARRRPGGATLGPARLPVMFGLLTVPAYAALTSWWVPLAIGERFALTLALPVLLGAVLGIERLGRHTWLAWPGVAVRVSTVVLGGLLLALLVQAPALLTDLGRVSGGS